MINTYEQLKAKAIKHESGLFYLIGENSTYKCPTVMVWRPNAKKPFANYRFDTMEQLQIFIEKKAESLLEWNKIKEARKAARLGTPEQIASVKVGDIFHYSWGYEQTNADFYEVVAKKGVTVTLREIETKSAGAGRSGSMSGVVVPIAGAFKGEPIKKKLRFDGSSPSVSFEFGWCGLWDGRPVHITWYA